MHCERVINFYSQETIASLQSALQRAQEERDEYKRQSEFWKKSSTEWKESRERFMERAEKAEERNRRMAELMKEPSEEMIAAGYPPNDERAQSWDVTEVFKAMSDELLKESKK